jgi:hypothetical protein
MNRLVKLISLVVMSAIVNVAFAQNFLFNGRAAGAEAVLADGSTHELAVAGPLSRRAGGEDWARYGTVQLLNFIFTDSITAYTKGEGNQVVAQSKITKLRIANPNPLLPDLVSADSIISRSYDSTLRPPVGGTVFENLRISGIPVSIGNGANVRFALDVPSIGVVRLILNHQSHSRTGDTIHTVAVSIILPTGEVLNLAHTSAGLVPVP